MTPTCLPKVSVSNRELPKTMISITAEFGAPEAKRVFPFGCLSNGGFLGISPLDYPNTPIKKRGGPEQTPLFEPFEGTNAPAARARRRPSLRPHTRLFSNGRGGAVVPLCWGAPKALAEAGSFFLGAGGLRAQTTHQKPQNQGPSLYLRRASPFFKPRVGYFA